MCSWVIRFYIDHNRSLIQGSSIHGFLLICQGGGILDPASQLKIADFSGKGGPEKLLAQVSASAVAAAPKAKAKARGGQPNSEAQQARKERLVVKKNGLIYQSFLFLFQWFP